MKNKKIRFNSLVLAIWYATQKNKKKFTLSREQIKELLDESLACSKDNIALKNELKELSREVTLFTENYDYVDLGVRTYICECGEKCIGHNDKYCRQCGIKIKWIKGKKVI